MADGFFDSPRARVDTSAGGCELPILYRDCSWFGLFFRVDLEAARALIPDQRVEPWPVMGAAVAAIYVYEYRDTSIGPYGELGLGIQCRRVGSKPSLLTLLRDMGAQDEQGIWVVNLPVSTPAACAAGIELWGYPKYVTPITTRFERDLASVQLGNELKVTLPTPKLISMKGQPTTTFSRKGDQLLRTVVGVNHQLTWGGGGGTKIEVLDRTGPTAKTIEALGLTTRSPVAAARCDAFRAVLPAGVAQAQ